MLRPLRLADVVLGHRRQKQLAWSGSQALGGYLVVVSMRRAWVGFASCLFFHGGTWPAGLPSFRSLSIYIGERERCCSSNGRCGHPQSTAHGYVLSPSQPRRGDGERTGR